LKRLISQFEEFNLSARQVALYVRLSLSDVKDKCEASLSFAGQFY